MSVASASNASVLGGDALVSPPPPGMLMAHILERAASLHPSRGLLHLDANGNATRQNYPDLLSESERIAGGLRSAGVAAGDRVIFQLDRSGDFFPAFWACMLAGFIPVPVSLPPDYDQAHPAVLKLRNAWQTLGTPVILTSRERASALERCGVQMAAGWTVTSIDKVRQAPPDAVRHTSVETDTVVLFLTSGSTGIPKAVALSHHNLVAQCAGNIQVNDVTERDVSLNWMPLDHVGALIMLHLRDVFAGCDQAHVLTEAVLSNPGNWLRWIDRYRATNTWAPNFAFALVNDLFDTFENEAWDLSCLRFAINGGEAVVSRTARRFLALLARFKLPPTAIRPAWGMSETCSGTTFG
ncbi:MAG TPA: AMP-binding protein, partial [Opitutaceae bacterium]